MKQFILVLLFINYHIIDHMNSCKPNFAYVCTGGEESLEKWLA